MRWPMTVVITLIKFQLNCQLTKSSVKPNKSEYLIFVLFLLVFLFHSSYGFYFSLNL